jgi:hypothetical protein
MKRRPLTLIGLLILITGCGTQVVTAARPTVAAAERAPLGTSLVTAQGTWAIAVMGGSAADENNFWQLFVRPSADSTWRLVTPPAVADNGGLVAAGSPASLLIGFRPSQDLLFSPLATSTSGGKNWTAAVLNADLANSPDALATAASGQELALLSSGTIDTSTDGGATWSRLPALATSAAGRSCGVVGVNAVAFWSDETPVAAASCERPGVAGIFRDTAGTPGRKGGTWEPAGPLLPAAYARDPVRVLRLSGPAAGSGSGGTGSGGTGSGGTVALLQAGQDLLATWWSGTGWASPVALSVASGPAASGVRATGFGANGSAWVLLGDGAADTISGPGGTWVGLPAVPSGTAVLALGGAGPQALVPRGSKLTVWQLTSGAWSKVQVVTVPIVYGSSS